MIFDAPNTPTTLSNPLTPPLPAAKPRIARSGLDYVRLCDDRLIPVRLFGVAAPLNDIPAQVATPQVENSPVVAPLPAFDPVPSWVASPFSPFQPSVGEFSLPDSLRRLKTSFAGIARRWVVLHRD